MTSAISRSLHLRRNLISGIVTVIPLWITWLLVDFVLRQLSKFGAPWVRALAGSVNESWPLAAALLLEPWFQNLLAIVLVLLALYALGWTAHRVVGRRILAAIEGFFDRLPLVQTIYGSAKKLVTALHQPEPGRVQRIVLIDFPSSELKAVGLVTATLQDASTGEELAAVYVPTTPNPTSGYVEIVPTGRITPTEWTMDEAMNFLISGGAVAPPRVHYHARAGEAGP